MRDRLVRFFFEVPKPGAGGKPTTQPLASTATATPGPRGLPTKAAFVVHPPYGSQQCLVCHEQPGKIMPREQFMELCAECHEDYFDEYTYVHPPVADKQCLLCHNMHRSKFAGLLRAPQREVCLECHDEEIMEADYHRGHETQKCSSCHQVHFGESSLLEKAQQVPAG